MLKRARTALLLIGSLGLATGAGAQTPIFERGEGFTAPGIGITIGLGARYPVFHEFIWGPAAFNTLTTCTVKLEKSQDGVTWTDLIPAQDCTTVGKLREITGNVRFVRNNVTALSGGTLSVWYRGFDGRGCGSQYPGIVSVIVGADPAPGVEQVITVPSTERWNVLSARFELVTNSTAGDRSVFFSIDTGGDEYFRTFADGLVQANQRGIFTASPLGFVGTIGLGPSSIHQPVDVRTILIPVQQGIYVPGGHNFRTTTDRLEPGDDFSAATLLVERCPN